MGYLYTYLYPLTSVITSIVVVLFGIVTAKLINWLYIRDDTNNNHDQPTKCTKNFAVVSSILYTTSYIGITIVYITFSVTQSRSSTFLDVITFITVIAYISALLSFHTYLLNRIHHHIEVYSQLISYKCYFMCKLHKLVYYLLVILGVLYLIVAILRAQVGVYDKHTDLILDQISSYCIFIALFIDEVITIMLLVIYIRSIHQVALVCYYRDDYNWAYDDRQHELMLRATRVMVVQCWYIIWTLMFYIFAIVAVSYRTQISTYFKDRIGSDLSFAIGHAFDWIMIIVRDIFTVSALYLGFEFGHTGYEKYCCCTEWMKRKCHDLIEFQNGRYKMRAIQRRGNYTNDYVEINDIVLTDNQMSNGSEMSANNLILCCCCCPIEINV